MAPVDEEQERPGRALESARDVFGRRRGLAALTFTGALVAVLSVVLFLPDVYRSSATVLIERQQIPDELVRSTVTSELETRLHTISQEILSRSRLEALIDRFDLYPRAAQATSPVEEVVERMRERHPPAAREATRAGRRRERATVAFTISYHGQRSPEGRPWSPTRSPRSTSRRTSRSRERQAAGTAEFLRVQLEDAKRRLDDAGAAGGTLQGAAHRASCPSRWRRTSPPWSSSTPSSASTARTRSWSASGAPPSRSSSTTSRGRTRPAGRGTRPSAWPRSTGSSRSCARATATSTPTWSGSSRRSPTWRRSGASGAGGRGRPARRCPPARRSWSMRTAAVASSTPAPAACRPRPPRLQAALARYQQRVENVPRTEQEYQKLARDYETTQELYRSLLTRQSQAEVAESMEQRQKGEQFRVIEPALASAEADRSRPPQADRLRAPARAGPGGGRGRGGRAARHLLPHRGRPPPARARAGAGEHPAGGHHGLRRAARAAASASRPRPPRPASC